MRQIELKIITESTLDPRTGHPVDSKFSYRDNMVNALRYPQGQQQGIDYAEMAKLMPVLQRLQKAEDGEKLNFEDADWSLIVERVKSLRWLVAGETAFNFVTYLVEASALTTAPIPKKKGAA